MYRFIGGDGVQYGPISAEQLCQWIAERRATAQSLAQAEGASEWKPLSAFPEFADALRAQAPPLPTDPPPPRPVPDHRALADAIIARGFEVDFAHCLSRGWDLLTRNFWLLVGACFVVGLIDGAVPLLHGVLLGGLFWLCLRLIRGERAEFGDAFAGFSVAFLPLFLAGLVKGILVSAGLLLCLLPGIYLTVAWLFAFPLIIDKKLDFWPAMEVSLRVVNQRWWQFFALVLVNLLVVCAGLLVCCVGVYVAYPITIAALAYAYEDLFGIPRPPIPQADAPLGLRSH